MSNFQVLADDEAGWQTLECQQCGEVFDTNMETEDNLLYDFEEHALIVKCPHCGTLGEW